jgi:hypothetical protein
MLLACFTVSLAQDPRRDAANYSIRFHVMSYHGASCDNRATPNCHALSNDRSAANPDFVFNDYRLRPLTSSLARDISETVIHCLEHYSWADMNILSDNDVSLRNAESNFCIQEGASTNFYVLCAANWPNGNRPPNRTFTLYPQASHSINNESYVVEKSRARKMIGQRQKNKLSQFYALTCEAENHPDEFADNTPAVAGSSL